MRYQKGRKEETRQHIIDVAAKRFREDGIASAGIAGLMADAGLTNGAFYTHFTSKEDLVRQTLLALPASLESAVVQAIRNGVPAEVWVRQYLSQKHRDNPGTGCIAATLSAELARHPEETRVAFHAGYDRTVRVIADSLEAGASQERLATARSVYSLLIGSLQLARVIGRGSESDDILESGIQAALALMHRHVRHG